MNDIRRLLELIVLPALVLAAIALPVPLMADRLPDPLASHWGVDGRPDGSAEPAVLVLAITGVWLALWGLLGALARRADARAGGPLPEAVPVLGVGGFLAGLMALTVIANDGAATWRDAHEVNVLGGLAAVATGLVLCGVALLLGRGRRHGRQAGAPGPATIGLGPSEHAVWVGHASSPALALGGALGALALAGGAFVAGDGAGWILLGSALALALAVTWISTVRVTVSEQGLRIAFGPFGTPSKRMALERIARAEATEIEPLRWGGWGYRWAGRGRSAVVVRRGPGLVVDLRDGRRFAVTVDEPAPAAGLINDLRRRHAPG